MEMDTFNQQQQNNNSEDVQQQNENNIKFIPPYDILEPYEFDDIKTIFLANIKEGFGYDEIKEIFPSLEAVSLHYSVYDNSNKKIPKRYSFVHFKTTEEVNEIIAQDKFKTYPCCDYVRIAKFNLEIKYSDTTASEDSEIKTTQLLQRNQNNNENEIQQVNNLLQQKIFQQRKKSEQTIFKEQQNSNGFRGKARGGFQNRGRGRGRGNSNFYNSRESKTHDPAYHSQHNVYNFFLGQQTPNYSNY